ncbi:MAG: hypothetical protein B6D34_00035 [Candidatus Brocadia sp. UTAMX1]|nr:MAG: hypothetical protein B6D34_00035 [Candidatus Brocadia sp. UTAMX1]
MSFVFSNLFYGGKEKMKLNGRKSLWLLLVMVVPLTYSGFASKGSLEPTDPPGTTMRRMQEKIQQSWDQKITKASKRFKVVLDGAGVLDKETGLVWEKSPDTSTIAWPYAVAYAYNKNVGGRGGWRLPTVEELRTLIEPTQSNPALPSGHPFIDVQSDLYWSSTTDVNLSSYANGVHFGDGNVSSLDKTGTNFYVWCVRGGHGYDAY